MDNIIVNTVTLSLKELIIYYHNLKPKLKLMEICNIINTHHGFSLSYRKLKELCKKYQLTRARNISDSDLMELVSNEVNTSLCQAGYRQFTDFIMLKYNLKISMEAVRKTLKLIDPSGVEERRNKVIKRRIYGSDGPGDIFHIDGNDKLKKWGFAIHGCIDGFSRKIIWLEVSTSNNDPVIIAHYFLKAVKNYQICPKLLRMDNGTENIYCQDLQVFFTGSNQSYLCAASTRNQRIESFWSRLKRYKTNWWIDFFHSMVKDKIYCPSNEIHVELLLYCFMPIIQYELNQFAKVWNARNVRKSSAAPGGRPDVLFHMPGSQGFTKQGIAVSNNDLAIAQNIVDIEHQPFYINSDIRELIECYIALFNILISQNAEGALDAYISILNCFCDDGFIV